MGVLCLRLSKKWSFRASAHTGVGISPIIATFSTQEISVSLSFGESPGGELPKGQERPPWGAPACGLVRDDRSFLTRSVISGG